VGEVSRRQRQNSRRLRLRVKRVRDPRRWCGTTLRFEIAQLPNAQARDLAFSLAYASGYRQTAFGRSNLRFSIWCYYRGTAGCHAAEAGLGQHWPHPKTLSSDEDVFVGVLSELASCTVRASSESTHRALFERARIRARIVHYSSELGELASCTIRASSESTPTLAQTVDGLRLMFQIASGQQQRDTGPQRKTNQRQVVSA